MFFFPFGYLSACLEAGRLMSEAAVTIGARSLILMEAAMRPGRALDPEIPRMIAEKLAAAAQGAAAAQAEFAALAASALAGASLPELAGRLTRVGEAGLRPAKRRLHANAKRLSRPRSSMSPKSCTTFWTGSCSKSLKESEC